MRDRVVKCRGFGVVIALLLGVPGGAAAQSSIGAYISVNAGMVQPAPSTFTRTAAFIDGSDREEVQTTTRLKSSGLFDIGGGIVLAQRFTIGAAFERSSRQQPADIVLSLSHPDFHPTLSATAETEALERSDTALHVQFGYRVVSTPVFTVTVFGGPSYVSTRHEALSEIGFDEPFNPVTRSFTAEIWGFDTDSIAGSGWGYNAGADGSYFLSKYVGLGGMVRYSRANIDLENPLQSILDERTVKDQVKAGGWSVTGGLRLRF